jgi:RimJ/RimL family protein N-acetyltransferase
MEFRPPVTLTGDRVELVPLERTHSDALYAASRDPRVGQFLLLGTGKDRAEFDAMVATLFDRQATGRELLFATTLRPGGRPVGMTRYIDIDRPCRSVEIGGTWIDPSFWRTPVNTEAKLLMFRHAFEREGAHRVWLRTDLLNERSQRAIERLGAVREAVLREHLLRWDGRFRSSVYYSVLEGEWPAVRARLEERLRRPWEPPAPERP